MLQRVTGPCQGSLLYNDKAQADINIRRQAGYIDQARSGPCIQQHNDWQTTCTQQTPCARNRQLAEGNRQKRRRANCSGRQTTIGIGATAACVLRVTACRARRWSTAISVITGQQTTRNRQRTTDNRHHAGGPPHPGDHGARDGRVLLRLPVVPREHVHQSRPADGRVRECKPACMRLHARPHAFARTPACMHSHAYASKYVRMRKYVHAYARTHMTHARFR